MTKRTPRDAMVKNLQQRLDAALAEVRRQRERADDAELNLDMAWAQRDFYYQALPFHVRQALELDWRH